MGTKTTVNNKGVFSTKTSSTAISFIVDGKKINKTFNAAVDGNATVGNKSVVVLEAATVAVTAALPVIVSENVGLQYTFVNADTANEFAISGTQPFNGGVEWEIGISARTAAVIAVSSSANGYSWEQLY